MTEPSMKGTDFVVRSLGFVLDDIGSILKTMAPWIVPLLILGLWPIVNPDGFAGQTQMALQKMQLTGRPADGPTLAQWGFIFFSGVIQMVVIAGFAASQHRRVLQHVMPLERTLPQAVPPYVGYWLVAAIVIGVLWVLLLLLLSMLAPAIPQWLFWTLFALVAFAMLAVAMRGILVFPAIAVGDRTMTFERSFALTLPGIWRMLLCLLLITLILFVLYFAIGMVVGLVLISASLTTKMIVITILQLVLEFISTAAFVTYVSLVYAYLAHGKTPTPGGW